MNVAVLAAEIDRLESLALEDVRKRFNRLREVVLVLNNPLTEDRVIKMLTDSGS